MQLPSPAKINRFLHVIGKRADGYHELKTLFQFLALADTLRFESLPQPTILRVDQHDFTLPDEDLTIRAAKLLQPPGHGVRITLNKVIPPGSGLGGGSSNAATTLLALNHLWKLGLTRDRLAELGLQLGADIPVFIHGHAALASGIGEVLSPIADNDAPTQWLCVCLPPVNVSTAEVFAQMRKLIPVSQNHTNTDTHATDCHPDQSRNDLQPITVALYPEVATALACLRRYGDARMSGSGGATYVGFDSQKQAECVAAQLPKHLPKSFTCFVTRTTNHHPLVDFPATLPRSF